MNKNNLISQKILLPIRLKLITFYFNHKYDLYKFFYHAEIRRARFESVQLAKTS